MEPVSCRKRIGWLFSVVALLVFAMNVIGLAIRHEPISALWSIDYMYFIMVAVVYLFSALVENRLAYILQVVTLVVCGGLVFRSGGDSCVSGIFFLILALLLAFHYQFFDTHIRIKLLAIIPVSFVVFFSVPGFTNSNKLLSAIAWTLLFWVFIFVTWFIFKDSISKLKEKELESNERLIHLLEESRIATETAMEIGKEAIKELKKRGGCNES